MLTQMLLWLFLSTKKIKIKKCFDYLGGCHSEHINFDTSTVSFSCFEIIWNRQLWNHFKLSTCYNSDLGAFPINFSVNCQCQDLLQLMFFFSLVWLFLPQAIALIKKNKKERKKKKEKRLGIYPVCCLGIYT